MTIVSYSNSISISRWGQPLIFGVTANVHSLKVSLVLSVASRRRQTVSCSTFVCGGLNFLSEKETFTNLHGFVHWNSCARSSQCFFVKGLLMCVFKSSVVLPVSAARSLWLKQNWRFELRSQQSGLKTQWTLFRLPTGDKWPTFFAACFSSGEIISSVRLFRILRVMKLYLC